MEKRSRRKEPTPDTTKSLIEWRLLEEKKEYSRDKELLIALIGAASVTLTIMAETYVFSALLVIATGMFIYLGRQEPKTRLFSITEEGIFLDNDFIEREEIKEYNIIDDPGERARLILRIKKVIDMNEIIPIYDVDMTRIEKILKTLGVRKDEDLVPNALDRLILHT